MSERSTQQPNKKGKALLAVAGLALSTGVVLLNYGDNTPDARATANTIAANRFEDCEIVEVTDFGLPIEPLPRGEKRRGVQVDIFTNSGEEAKGLTRAYAEKFRLAVTTHVQLHAVARNDDGTTSLVQSGMPNGSSGPASTKSLPAGEQLEGGSAGFLAMPKEKDPVGLLTAVYTSTTVELPEDKGLYTTRADVFCGTYELLRNEEGEKLWKRPAAEPAPDLPPVIKTQEFNPYPPTVTQ